MTAETRNRVQPPLWLLIAFGSLLGGLGEFAVRLVVRQWSSSVDKSFHLNPQAIWMGPLAALPVVAVAALVGVVLTRQTAAEHARRHALPLGLVVAVAALQAAMTTTRVHFAALALLAAGIGMQSARIAAARPRFTRQLIMWSTVLMCIVSITGSIAWNVRDVWGGKENSAPADAQSPNVILLILDTVRADRLSVYGYQRATTPALSALAGRGILFERALATAPWTLPSHATMFTGRYPQELNVGWDRPLNAKHPTIAERLDARGYSTAGFVANTFYGSYLHGLSRGFETYRDYPISTSEVFGASNINRRLLNLWNRATGQYHEIGRKDATDINREMLRWLDSRPSDRPFFVFANYFDAHMSYVPPAPYDTLYLGREAITRSVYQGTRGQPSAAVVADLSDAYDGALTWLDSQLGALFSELQARALLDNTAIIVSSDHGESLGEHGFVDHGSSLYLPELHVPLLMALPGNAAAGCVVKPWVTLRDLAATIWDVTGGSTGTFEGRSLMSYCLNPTAGDSAAGSSVYAENDQRGHLPVWYPSSGRALRSVIADDYHLIAGNDSANQLFHTRDDYEELRDLAGRPEYSERLQAMFRIMNALTQPGDTRPSRQE